MVRIARRAPKKPLDAGGFTVQPLPNRNEGRTARPKPAPIPLSAAARAHGLQKHLQPHRPVPYPAIGSQADPLRKLRAIKCHICRQFGHVTDNCPQGKPLGVQHCHHCRSMSHTTRICPLPASEKTYKFGVCTECQGHGHIADQCPNRNPDDHPTQDGVCQFCGSNYHVLRKCPERLKELKKMDDKPITLGKITADQGGDDDDVFLEMRHKDIERLRHKTQPKTAPKKAKVVTF